MVLFYWLNRIFITALGVSLVKVSGSYSLLRCTDSALTGFSSCSLWCSMWDLPRPGIKFMSPALADRFLSTVPPGKLIHRALQTSLCLGSCLCIQCKFSPSVMSDSLQTHGQAPLFMGVSRREYQSELHFLLQGIFPTQGSSPCPMHSQVNSLSLSHQGSPYIH